MDYIFYKTKKIVRCYYCQKEIKKNSYCFFDIKNKRLSHFDCDLRAVEIDTGMEFLYNSKCIFYYDDKEFTIFIIFESNYLYEKHNIKQKRKDGFFIYNGYFENNILYDKDGNIVIKVIDYILDKNY